MKNAHEKKALVAVLAVVFGGAAAAAETGSLSVGSANKTSGDQEMQGKVGDNVASPDVGVGVPVSDLNLSKIGAGNQRPGDSGLGIGVRYMYQLSDRLGVGGELSHTNYGDRDFVVPDLAGTIGGSLLTVEGLARYWLTPPYTVNPYVIGGLGFNHFACHVRLTNDPGVTLLDGDSFGLALSAGGGVEGRFGSTKQLVAAAEVRWMLDTIDSGAFGSSVINGMGIGGRVGYRF